MQIKSKMSIAFYQHLGKLFYAVAAIDKTVRSEEISRLQKCVTDSWLPLDNVTDEFKEDTAFQIEIVFNWLDAQVIDASEAYEEFKEYYINNKETFTPEINHIISKTTAAIAAAFSGINKSELGIMAKLSLLFNS